MTAGAHAPHQDKERDSPAQRRRFTVVEYHRMIETGILDADEHVELLEGEIVQVSPQEPPHARATSRLNRWFARALGEEYVVRPQLPLTFPESEPEPDLAVVWTKDEDRLEGHPRTALLVIEVADSSARHDLVVKSRVYAKAGIPEYWLVLVRKRSIEVLRDPDAAAGVYRSRSTAGPDSTLTPSAFSGPVIEVRALFA